MNTNMLMEMDPLSPYECPQFNGYQIDPATSYTNQPYTYKNPCNYNQLPPDTSKICQNLNNDNRNNDCQNNDNGTNGCQNNGNGTNDCQNNGNGNNGFQNNDNGNNDTEDVKPPVFDIKQENKKKRGKQSNYWNKKVDKNYPFYGCSVCNISFMEIQQLDQHVTVHTNRITSYDLRQLNKKKRKKIKKEKKKIKKDLKVKKEEDIEIKPEDGYIGNEVATEYKVNENDGNGVGKNENDVGNSENVVGKNENGVGKDENGVEKSENGVGKNENGVGKDENGTGKDGNENGKKSSDNERNYIKVYKCFACNKEFALSYYLKIHVRSHTDDKPYSCKVCNQSFITASKLGRHHKRTHEQSARKQCRICFKVFSRFDLLVAHFDKVHAEDKLEGEPYDYNAILPYLQELEDQLKTEGDIKMKEEEGTGDTAPGDTCGGVAKQETGGLDAIIIPKSDEFTENETSILIEEIKVDMDIKQEPDDADIHDFPDITDDTDIPDNPVETDNPVEMNIPVEYGRECLEPAFCDVKGENTQSSDSDYFPSDGCAGAERWPAEGAGGACDVCHKTFSTKSYLTVHMRTHTGEKPFSCYVCSRRFITANKMHRHVLTHKNWKDKEKKKGENDNDQEIKTECETDEDEKLVKEEKPLKKGKSKKNKTKEPKKKKKYTKRPHVCEFCHKKFLHLSTLEIHKKSHEGEELVYRCNYCLEPHTDGSQLREHEATHAGPRPYLCTDCGKTYTKRETMIYHKKNHKPLDANSSYQCDICSKRLGSAHKLQRHLVSHSTDKYVLRYECPVCAHMFHTRYHTAMHLSTHMKEGLILEENRNAVLAMVLQNARKIPKNTPTNLNIPETVASDERSRICNICGQIFQHFYYLEEHLKTHASKISVEDFDKQENKKYQCSVCSKSFKLHYYLKLHNYTHTHEKPFICQQCGKGFITKGKLKRHLETHEGLKKYQCHVCYKFFTRPSYLRIHVRTIHGTQDYSIRDYGLGVPLNTLVNNGG